MKDKIIKDYDQFKKVNESDMSLFGFLAGQVGGSLEKAAKQRALAMVLEYFGVPKIDNNDPQGKSQWITELFVKIMSEVSLPDCDRFLDGSLAINDSKYWVPRIAKALKYQIIQLGRPSAGDVVEFLGVTPGGFLGRLITNMYSEYILDEKRLEQTILALWKLVMKEDFIPQRKADEIYQAEYDKLTDEQKEKVEGSVWKASMKQKDFARTKGD
jgi:hypothetical protein